MQRVLILGALSLALLSNALALNDSALQALGRRAFKYSRTPPKLLIEVDHHLPRDAHTLLDDLTREFHPRADPILIYSWYPREVAPIIAAALGRAKPGSLRGLVVVCGIGPRPSTAVTTAAARSGATVDFQPIP